MTIKMHMITDSKYNSDVGKWYVSPATGSVEWPRMEFRYFCHWGSDRNEIFRVKVCMAMVITCSLGQDGTGRAWSRVLFL